MEKGEFTIFCKDFDMRLPLQKYLEIFRSVSLQQSPLDLNQFKEILPVLGLEYAQQKAKETKHRLKEIKKVLLYPETQITESIEHIINGIDSKHPLGKKIHIDQRKSLQKVIEDGNLEQERTKTLLILNEIQRILKKDKVLADSEQTLSSLRTKSKGRRKLLAPIKNAASTQ